MDKRLYDEERATGLPLRVAYLGMPMACDRDGRFAWRPVSLKYAVCPNDDVDFMAVLDAFVRLGFVVPYEVGGEWYGMWTPFHDEIRVNPREAPSFIPAPAKGSEAFLASPGNWTLLGELDSAVTRDNIATSNGEQERVDASPSKVAGKVDEKRGGYPSGHTLFDGSLSKSVGSLSGGENYKSPPEERVSLGEEISTFNNSPLLPTTKSQDKRTPAPATAHALARPRLLEANAQEKNRAPSAEKSSPGRSPRPSPHSAPSSPDGSLGIAAMVSARNVPALPPVRGQKTAVALVEQLHRVFSEIEAGTRDRLSQDQADQLGARLVFAYWAKRTGHDETWYDPKREARIMARLHENDRNVSELLYAVDGLLRSPNHMGKNDTGTKYDKISNVFRDREQVEHFVSLVPKAKRLPIHPLVDKYRRLLSGESTEDGG